MSAVRVGGGGLPLGVMVPSVSSTCRRGGCLKVLRCPVSAVRVGVEVALRC